MYVICSNPSCKFNKPDHHNLNACPECGGSLIAQCPNCSAYLRHKGGFCHECAQPLKPPAD